jgi:signal transduction histidine kinase
MPTASPKTDPLGAAGRSTLLATKLYVPPPRPRLTERLARGWPARQGDGMRYEANDADHPTDWLSLWIYYLASSLYFGAVFLRSLLVYRHSAVLVQVLGLLLVWLALSVSEPVISRRWSRYFPIYLILQTTLVFVLLVSPLSPDYFATLLAVLSMQVMLRLNPKAGAFWIGLCALIMPLLLVRTYGNYQAIALTLIYTAANVFFGSYTLAMRRAQVARAHNQALAQELREANNQLQAFSTQLEQLTVARERNRLARELHDAVTQTVFSMTLTTQSALLLLDRDPSQVSAQLDRLNQLAQGALSEMQVLISELSPQKVAREGLVPALRRYLAGSRLPENLSVSLQVEGDRPLELAEEQGLFRIAQEALNNIMKHAQASQARIRLCLSEPFWMEIEDEGKGFDLRQAQNSARVGLASMHERAAEIGWHLQITTSPGTGTRIRVEKAPVREGQV